MLDLSQERWEQLDTLLDAALDRPAELHLPPTHDMIGTAKLRLGLCFVSRNDFEQAEPLILAALENYEVSAPDAGAPIARQALANLYQAWDQPSEAAKYR